MGAAFGKHSLGAVTAGNMVRYEVTASTATALKMTGAQAVCFPDLDSLLSSVQWLARNMAARASVKSSMPAGWTIEPPASMLASRARQAKIAGKKGDELTELAAEMQVDIARLRRNGVKGKIPACVYKSTGRATTTGRADRRSTAKHEEYHARLARAREELGLREATCPDARLRDALVEASPDAARSALVASVVLRWSGRQHAEEVLARLEEIRSACVRSDADCADVKRVLERQMTRSSQPATTMADLEAAVSKRFGSPLGAAKHAFNKCAGVTAPRREKPERPERKFGVQTSLFGGRR